MPIVRVNVSIAAPLDGSVLGRIRIAYAANINSCNVVSFHFNSILTEQPTKRTAYGLAQKRLSAATISIRGWKPLLRFSSEYRLFCESFEAALPLDNCGFVGKGSSNSLLTLEGICGGGAAYKRTYNSNAGL